MILSAEVAGLVFGLVAAASWGAGDFSGGLATKRTSVFGVIAVAHVVGLLLLLALALFTGEVIPSTVDMLWGAAAGIAGTIGLAALYSALASGHMGLAAPISAVLTAGVPVVFGIFSDGLPGGLKLLGFACGVVSLWLVSYSGGGLKLGAGLNRAILAGISFGMFFILIGQVQSEAVFWPLVAARAMSCIVMWSLVVARRPVSLPGGRSQLILVALAGILDVGGNAFFVIAAQAGRLDVAAVVTSLYPASTILLARIILKEHMTRQQFAGVAVALLAVVLIAI